MRVMIFMALIIATTVPAFAHFVLVGALDGTVRDSATAVPVANAAVTATSAGCKVTVSTDQAGRFAFVGLAVGKYTLIISKPGYRSVFVVVNITSGRSSTNVTIDLQKSLRTVIVEFRHWPGLVNPGKVPDVYVPLLGIPRVNVFDSVFGLLPFVPGLTFGSAPRMMR